MTFKALALSQSSDKGPMLEKSKTKTNHFETSQLQIGNDLFSSVFFLLGFQRPIAKTTHSSIKD